MNKRVCQREDRRTAPAGQRDCANCTRTATGPSIFKLEKILVPVDFSDCGKKALQYAIPFARQFRAQMILLHVMPLHFTAAWDGELNQDSALTNADLRSLAENQLMSLVHDYVPSRIATCIEVRHGAPSIEIVNAAREDNAGLIIMSTHGHTGRLHAFIGSVAADVTRLAPCPVLVVREREKDFVPAEVLAAKDDRGRPQTAGAFPS